MNTRAHLRPLASQRDPTHQCWFAARVPRAAGARLGGAQRAAAAAIVACLMLAACSEARSADQRATPTSEQAQPPFVGKVWMSTDAAAAPGTLRIFLSNGTLVMDSCWETYHLARWRSVDERRIEWQEGTEKIEAEVVEITDDRLVLRLQLVGEAKEEAYRAARIPYICPDMPR